MKIRTRFAPSPTGYLHIGALRTAFYAYLFARHHRGDFYLRIEDTDRERYVEGAVENLTASLKLMGLEWDNRVIMFQSKRTDIYRQYAEKLIAAGHAYYCFCTPERLAELRARQEKNKLATGYDGFCRDLDRADVHARVERKEPCVIRLKMPKTGVCTLTDCIRGKIEFSYAREEDPVIIKSDGFPTYHLAHVIDDHEMAISHVIRGEEWLSSVPKHITLWQAFGWSIPEYAHLPLILNSDRSKLSKRKGDVAVEDYLKRGYLKEAILNFILLLGWNPGTDQEIFNLEQMTKAFTLEKVHTSAAIFNLEKLDWINGYYIRSLSLDKLCDLSLPYLREARYIGNKYDHGYVREVIQLEQPRLRKLSDLPALVDYFFLPFEYEPDLLLWKEQTPAAALEHLSGLTQVFEKIQNRDYTKEKIESAVAEYITRTQSKNGQVLWPLRVALSGKKASPGPYEIAAVLKQAAVLERLKKAQTLLRRLPVDTKT